MKANVFQYIEVAPGVPLPAKGKQTYTYHIDTKEDVPAYAIVKIPLGNRIVSGITLDTQGSRPAFPTKPAQLIFPGNTISDQQIAFARHLASVMHGGLGYTLRLFLPPAGKEVLTEESEPLKPHKILLPIRRLYNSATKEHSAMIEHNQTKRHEMLAQLAYLCAKNGQQTAILVPEISLINPLIKTLERYVPNSRLAAFHAGLPVKEVHRVWHGAQHNTISVIVGSQKTLFLPWTHLRFIVVEQEYYPTHKLWDQYPRLHTVYASRMLGAIHKVPIILSSSFPSLLLRHEMEAKTITPIVHNPARLSTTIIAAQFEDKRQHKLLPQEFVQKLKNWARTKDKVFILCNKRGAWQIAVCKTCHTASRCPNCQATMLAHKISAQKKGYELICRQCDLHQPIPVLCVTCHKGKPQFIKPGVETIESVLQQLLPSKKITRLDADTLRSQNPQAISQTIAKHQIIIGTSAALTHLEGKQVSHIAWLFPEDTLLFPDMRSSERAWYMVARLSQSLKAGSPLVLVTRYQQLIEDTFKKGSDAVFTKELKIRKRFSYPPFADMVKLTFTSAKPNAAIKRAEKARQMLDKAAADKPIIIRGPFSSFSAPRLKKQPEAHILLLGPLAELTPLYKNLDADSVDYMPERIL